MDLFRKANPNVCFLLLVPHMAAERNYAWVKDIDALKDEASGLEYANQVLDQKTEELGSIQSIQDIAKEELVLP